MKKLTRQLKKRRRLLLGRYDDEDLHQLRITLRRMRSLLKPQPGKQAHRLRHDLGLLAVATNAARDWDTLVIHAAKLLPSPQFDHLLPLLEPFQSTAHAQVTGLLQSEQWFSAIKRWKSYHANYPGNRPPADGVPEQELQLALRRVITARNKALAHPKAGRWHKLRIAIKELRYRLDEIPKKARGQTLSDMLTLCKQLQEDLGEWHDTVVHNQLLREIPENVTAAKPQASAALDLLQVSIAQQGHETLERVRSSLLQSESLLTLDPN